jgi:hypothetical protein
MIHIGEGSKFFCLIIRRKLFHFYIDTPIVSFNILKHENNPIKFLPNNYSKGIFNKKNTLTNYNTSINL